MLAGLLWFVALLSPVGMARAETAPTLVTLQAEWAVHLESDGQGSDARGAQLLALLGALGGTQGVASAQDAVTLPAGGNGPYRIDSTLTPRGPLAMLLQRLRWVRSASGQMQAGRAELSAASSQRGDSPARTVRVEDGRMDVRTAGQTAQAGQDKPAPDGLLDPLTLGWGYLQRPLPTRPFTVPLLINDAVQTARVSPQPATLQWQGRATACTLLDAQSKDSSARLRIWLRQSDGLPLQIELGMGERYGLDVVQTLARIPAGLDGLRLDSHAAAAR